MHRLRFQPDEWMYHMVTTRCIQGQGLLNPLPSTNLLIAGCLAHALTKSAGAVRLHHYVFMSNHYHLIVSALNQTALSSFMGHLNGCLGRELAKRHGIQGHVWQRRYASHLLLDDESLKDAYRYLFANSVKEDLVEHPREWGGLHGYAQLCEGREVVGEWVDWTGLYRARRRALTRKTPTPEPQIEGFTHRVTLTVEPPDLWRGCTPDELRQRLMCWADEVASAESKRRRARGGQVLGMRRVLQEDIFKGRSIRPSPRPLCRAACPRLFAGFMDAYRCFARRFREASSALRAEVARSLCSPIVTFPPGGVPLGGGG